MANGPNSRNPGKAPEVVVITGASAGLGRATACEFARKGAYLGLIARGREGLEAVQREVEDLGGRALVIHADVADAEQIEQAAEKIEATLGPIDIWINSAMATVFGPLQQVSADEFRRVTEVTYLGQVHGTMAALKRMRRRNRGTIVHVGSALGYRSIPLQSAYCGAKHALNGFVESLRCELLHENSQIHLVLVQMPALNTPQFDWCRSYMPQRARPMAPVYQPEVGAQALYWAAHHRRRQLYVGFSSTLTIWGNKLAPRLMDYFVTATAYDGQQSPQAEQPGRADNLWQPLDRDYGAHGRFDDEAHAGSLQLFLATHRGKVGLLAGASLLLGAVALMQTPGRHRQGNGGAWHGAGETAHESPAERSAAVSGRPAGAMTGGVARWGAPIPAGIE